MMTRPFLSPRYLLLAAALAVIAVLALQDAPPAHAQDLAAPTNVEVDAGNARFTVTWTPVTGAQGYSVKVTNSQGTAGVAIPGQGSNLVTVSGTLANVGDIANGSTYSIQIQACKTYSQGLPSNCGTPSAAKQVSPGSGETLHTYRRASAYERFVTNDKFRGPVGSEHDVSLTVAYEDAASSTAVNWAYESAFACAWKGISTTDSAKLIKNDGTKPAECQHIRTGSSVSKLTLTQAMLDNGGVVILVAYSGQSTAVHGTIALARFVPAEDPGLLIEEPLWEATLTVKDMSGSRGCNDDRSATAEKCNAPATLSDDDFVFRGTTYTILQVYYSGTSFYFDLDHAFPAALDYYALHVGDKAFRLADTPKYGGGSKGAAQVDNHGLTWAAGDEIELALRPAGRSRTDTETRKLTPPPAPVWGTVTPAGASITFNWSGITPTQSCSVVTDYMIRLGDGDGLFVAGKLVTSTGRGLSHSATFDGLTPATVYQAVLNARTILGCTSAWSAVREVTTLAMSPPPNGDEGNANPDGSIPAPEAVGVRVFPTALNVVEGAAVTEDGSDIYFVVLGSRPAHDVTVTPTGSDDGAAAFSPASLTFTPEDWNVAQSFTVSGVADDDTGNESVTIGHEAASSDAEYDGIAVASVSVAVSDTTPEETEPRDVRVTPGDGALTVTWTVAPRRGFEDDEIYHALRWSQVSGVWANPAGHLGFKNDGLVIEGGVYTYTITGLENGVATGVFVRSFVGNSASERSPHSSEWVRTKGDHTTPRAAEPVEQEPPPEQPEQQQAAKTYSVSATAGAAEGNTATLTVTLSEAAPANGVAFTVTADYSGSSTADSADVGSITSPVTVTEGNSTLDISIPTAADAVDEDDETFTVTVAATTEGWDKAGDGKDTATVTIADDDTAGVTVTPTTLNISEDGSATYTVVLDSKPADDVFVYPDSADTGANYDQLPLVFDPESWDTPRTITVSGAADDDTDNESVTISHTAFSADAGYNDIAVASVSVAVDDTTPEPEQVEKPGPVVNMQLLAEADSLTVTWQAPESGDAPDRYIVHLKPADGSKGKVKKPRAGKTSVTFKKLESGATYEVRVRAENEAGKGERVSDTITLPEPTPEPEPDQPQEQGSSACMAYDTNGNGTIDADEAVAATIDYDNGVISRELLMEVLGGCR